MEGTDGVDATAALGDSFLAGAASGQYVVEGQYYLTVCIFLQLTLHIMVLGRKQGKNSVAMMYCFLQDSTVLMMCNLDIFVLCSLTEGDEDTSEQVSDEVLKEQVCWHS